MLDEISLIIGTKEKTIHSPIDNFFLFYYVIWATIFHNREFASDFKREVPHYLSYLRSKLVKGQRSGSRNTMTVAVFQSVFY
jgi:hypothetical protein